MGPPVESMEVPVRQEVTDTSVAKDPLEPSKEVSYKICVKTGDTNKAGTNAEIKIQIIGEKEYLKTEEKIMDNFFRNDFEQGRIDEFHLKMTDIGTPKLVRISKLSFSFRIFFLEKTSETLNDESYLYREKTPVSTSCGKLTAHILKTIYYTLFTIYGKHTGIFIIQEILAFTFSFFVANLFWGRSNDSFCVDAYEILLLSEV